MRVIKKKEIVCTCKRCQSEIGMLPHEVSTVGPPGPYDMDYEPDEIGKRYWTCPVCKITNWLSSPKDDDGSYY